MAHEAYSPVGYIYQADEYCLACIPGIVGQSGTVTDGCNCTECQLDRMANACGIDRYDETSFDSGDFPKAIPYHNDLHAECQDYSAQEGRALCGDRCAACGAEIDGPCPALPESDAED